MSCYVCIHGHFYQPPRENPWLESIDVQDSAAPFHDWNRRILEECYRPNAAARILDGQDRVARIVDNYSRISFNFGPTLLSWMEEHAPDVYGAVLAADARGRERFDGHGPAIAQVYSHPILPLCDARDRRTQVLWGVADFRRRFGREPEGMWLPETAVDTPSLEELAAAGMRFVVLAPSQARRWRRRGARAWTAAADGARVDPRRAYRVALPSGRSIAAFFYDGEIARGIAFGGLLERGDDLAGRLLGALRGGEARAAGAGDAAAEGRLVHAATDGETFGHHHRFGEMALAWALDAVERSGEAELTVYGAFLERHPPAWEAEIVERSAWSCAHGLGRWTEDCGCRTGGRPGWRQTWRAPLRSALDGLRDRLAGPWERAAGGMLRDPWSARDAYVDVVLDRSEAARRRFLEVHAARRLDDGEELRLFRLLELQRHLMLMYTSCGWFFDELSGIETVQVLQYAARALQLAEQALDLDAGEPFLAALAEAPSNLPEHPTGRDVWERSVAPLRIELEDVAANLAAARLFESGVPDQLHAGHEVDATELVERSIGARRLVRGTVALRARTTGERGRFDTAFVHLGEHDVLGGVRRATGAPDAPDVPHAGDADDATLERRFAEADLPGLLRALERRFAGRAWTFDDLFRDRQRAVLTRVLERLLADVDAAHRRIYTANASLMRRLHRLRIPTPEALQVAARRVLHADAVAALEVEPLDPDRVVELLDEAAACGAGLPGDAAEELGWTASERLARELDGLRAAPDDLARLDRVRRAAARWTGTALDLHRHAAQERVWRLSREAYPARRDAARAGDPAARAWVDAFRELAARLRVALPEEVPGP